MKQVIGIGSAANDGTGDPLRTAFEKTNQNFDELYETDEALAQSVAEEATARDTAIATAVGAEATARDAAIAVETAARQSALNLKANLASPTFTGTPAAPTAAGGTNTTQLATTAFVRSEVAALVASAPSALDTLAELSAALGADPNFAATMTTALAGKAPLASPALTGTPTAPTASPGANSTQLATTAYVDAADAALKLLPNNDQTASYVAVLADNARTTRMTVAGANTFTVPPNSSVAFPLGSVLPGEQWGAGATTITAGAGVTIRSRGGRLVSNGQYAAWALRKVGTDEWIAFGDLA